MPYKRVETKDVLVLWYCIRTKDTVHILKVVLGRGVVWEMLWNVSLLPSLVIFPLCHSTSSSFLCLSTPLSLPTRRLCVISKWTDQCIKLGIFTFHSASLQLVYRNFCCELYFRSSPVFFLFFASDFPPLLSRWFSVRQCCSHRWGSMRSYITQTRVWKENLESQHTPFTQVNKTDSKCYRLLWKCDIIVIHSNIGLCMRVDFFFFVWYSMVIFNDFCRCGLYLISVW
jgi:hypothetical protein